MTDAETQFIETMGLIAQRGGSPRISGRVFGLLILRDDPVALQDIADTLQVSKASASTNARLLRDRGMIKLISQPGERQDYYQLVPNPFQSMLEMLSLEMQHAARDVEQAQTAFDSDSSPDVQSRINNLKIFYQQSAQFLANTAGQLKDSTLSR